MAAPMVAAIVVVVGAITIVGNVRIPIGVPGRHFLLPPLSADCESACPGVSWHRRL